MKTKKLILMLMACLVISLVAEAQKQQGIVRTLEKAKRPSVGIDGVTVNILEYPNTLVTKKGGKFSFAIPSKKQGDSFKVSRVQKNGYTLVDKHLQGRQYSYSATVPLEIVMVSDKQLASDKKQIEDKAFARAKRTYETRIAELERQLAEKAISDSIYYAERERLSDDYDNYIKLIDEMAERYAMTDYKGLSEINRQILECIENAELERADSLINSKGDFDQREQELHTQMELNQATAEFLAKSQQDAEFKLNDLAEDYYNKYTIYAAHYRNDSAAYWLERRANLDTTNVEWQNEAGEYIYDCFEDYDLALEYYHKGLKQAHSQFGEDSEVVASSYDNIGYIYLEKAKYERDYKDRKVSFIDWVVNYQELYKRALEYYQKAQDILERIFGMEHPDVATSYDNIGTVYQSKGDYDKALEYYVKALDIRERVLGSDHTDVANSYDNLGGVYDNTDYSKRDYDKALEYYQKALDINERVLGPEHPNVAMSYYKIGLFVSGINRDYDKALEYFKKALEIRKHVFGLVHRLVARSFYDIGFCYVSKRDFDKALKYLQKSLDLEERVLGPNHLDVAITYRQIYDVYFRKGNYGKALAYAQKALDIYERALGPEHRKTQFVKAQIAMIKELMVQ